MTEKKTDQTDQKKPSTGKREYRTPELRKLGRISELTRTSSPPPRTDDSPVGGNPTSYIS